MAKTIKFNLICDDHPVRTLDDLREHFSIEDVLKYYQSGLLQKWLSVRGYEKELKAVTALSDTGDLEIIKKLIRIFEIETDEVAIEQGVYILEFEQAFKTQFQQYTIQKANTEQIIFDYEKGFMDLVNLILQNWNDMLLIKAVIQEMENHYRSQFEANYRTLFYTFYERAPMALFAMMMHDHMRQYYLMYDFNGKYYDDLPTFSQKEVAYERRNSDIQSGFFDVMLATLTQKEKQNKTQPVYNEQTKGASWQEERDFAISKLLTTDRAEMYKKFCELNTQSMLEKILGDNLQFYKGKTDNYWKDLESKDCKCMVLCIDYGDNVRSAGKKDQMLDYSVVNNKFVILDGIDYRSNMSSHVIYYLEV